MRLPAFAFAIVLAACSQASAASLHDVVRNALANYPAILVAQSNRSVARYDVERARALHYPTVDVLGTRRLAGAAQNLAQPRLRVNVWASGATPLPQYRSPGRHAGFPRKRGYGQR